MYVHFYTIVKCCTALFSVVQHCTVFFSFVQCYRHLWGLSYGRSKRATVRGIWPILTDTAHPCSNTCISGLEGSFWEIQKPRINRWEWPNHGERVHVKMHPRKVSYVQSNCVMRHRLWAIILQKNHSSGLEWCFWAIQKPRINSLVCYGFGTGFQVIGPPRGPNYGHSKEQRLGFSDFLGG